MPLHLMSENKVEFKILKDSKQSDIRLSDMSLDASKALKTLLEALTKIVEHTPDHENMRLNISEGSAVVAAVGTDRQITDMQKNFEKVANSDSTNNELVKAWRDVQGLVSRNGLAYEISFVKRNEKINVTSKIRNSRRFKARPARNTAASPYLFLEGRLIEAGGKNPNIHIINRQHESNIQSETIISCKEAEVEKIIKYIYKTVYLSAWTKRLELGNENLIFCDMYTDVTVYRSLKSFFESFTAAAEIERLDILHEIMYAYINDGSFGLLEKLMRLFNNDQEDVNVLKTLCVVTKGIKENPDIRDVREEILKKLNTKLQTPEH